MGTSYYELKIKNRSLIKKKGAKSLRREGLIPGVLYFKGEPTENIEVNKIVMNKAINSGQRIFEIQLEGEKQYSMIKEIQYDGDLPVIYNTDFMLPLELSIEIDGCGGIFPGNAFSSEYLPEYFLPLSNGLH